MAKKKIKSKQKPASKAKKDSKRKTKPDHKNKGTGKLGAVLITLGLLGAGIGVGMFFYFKPKQTAIPGTTLPEENDTPKPSAPKLKPNSGVVNNPSVSSSFPLKVGNKGTLVKQLQSALIEKYGKDILPKYGADGYYGKELTTALKAKNLPLLIDEELFNKLRETTPITQNQQSETFSPEIKENIDIAKNIWLNTTIKKLEPLIAQLKRIKSADQYRKINEIFKTIRLRGVRQTIVNAALSTFPDSTSKQFISEALKQIGLKYSGEQWHLSGFSERI